MCKAIDANGVVMAPTANKVSLANTPTVSVNPPAQKGPGVLLAIAIALPAVRRAHGTPCFNAPSSPSVARVSSAEFPEMPGIACCALKVLATNPPKLPYVLFRYVLTHTWHPNELRLLQDVLGFG
jgi:hypothetical protein